MENQEDRPVPSTIDRDKRYILVVDDNKFCVTLITNMISTMKYEYVIAENGKEAV